MNKLGSSFFLATLLTCLIIFSGQIQADNLTLLRAAVPADTEIIILEQGDDSYPALLQQAERADALGAILILTDTDSGKEWLEQSHALRLYLAEHGWWTLTSQLPITPHKLPDFSSEDTDGARAAHTASVQQRIQQGLQTLREREQERLLILAIGRSAAQATGYLHQNPAESNIRLILINPRPVVDTDWSEFLLQLSELETTLIDLYAEPYPPGKAAIPDARMRRNAARQAGLQNYHQSRIKTPWAGWHQEMSWLTRQVRGLLITHIIEADQRAREQAIATESVDQRPPGIRR